MSKTILPGAGVLPNIHSSIVSSSKPVAATAVAPAFKPSRIKSKVLAAARKTASAPFVSALMPTKPGLVKVIQILIISSRIAQCLKPLSYLYYFLK